MNTPNKTLWTIGHSTHPIDEFIRMLQAYDIKVLVDVRRFPASRKYPHFNRDALERALTANDIGYYHFEKLGGRRTRRPDSHNTGWRNDSFRGYADYMETVEFDKAAAQLMNMASKQTVAIMCAEAV